MDKDDILLQECYSELILEKDHRKKMNKFIDEDVANFLHEFDDKRSLWFANQINKMEGYQASQNKVNWINSRLITDMRGIIDWVSNTPNILLNKYSWEDAVAAHREYHSNLTANSLEGTETNTILKKYDDGFYWVDLESSRCPDEGDMMGHCANTSAETMYSLRKYTLETNSIEAFVTIAASPSDGVWQQAKGKQNSKPKEVYHKYIANILVEQELLQYKSEYNSENDFGPDDLIEYVNSHPNEFTDPDEIVQQIEDNTTSPDDFQKALDEFLQVHDMKYVSVSIDDYVDSDTLFADFSIYIEIDGDNFDFDVSEVVDEIDGDSIGLPSDVHNEIEISEHNGSLHIHAQFNTEDSWFSLDESGLSTFDSELNYAYSINNQVDINDIIQSITRIVYTQGIIDTKFMDFHEDLQNEFEDEYNNIIEISESEDDDTTIYYDVSFEEYSSDVDIRKLYKDTYGKFAHSKLNISEYSINEDYGEHLIFAYIKDFFKREFGQFPYMELHMGTTNPFIAYEVSSDISEMNSEDNIKTYKDAIKYIDENHDVINKRYSMMVEDLIKPVMKLDESEPDISKYVHPKYLNEFVKKQHTQKEDPNQMKLDLNKTKISFKTIYESQYYD